MWFLFFCSKMFCEQNVGTLSSDVCWRSHRFTVHCCYRIAELLKVPLAGCFLSRMYLVAFWMLFSNQPPATDYLRPFLCTEKSAGIFCSDSFVIAPNAYATGGEYCRKRKRRNLIASTTRSGRRSGWMSRMGKRNNLWCAERDAFQTRIQYYKWFFLCWHVRRFVRHLWWKGEENEMRMRCAFVQQQNAVCHQSPNCIIVLSFVFAPFFELSSLCQHFHVRVVWWTWNGRINFLRLFEIFFSSSARPPDLNMEFRNCRQLFRRRHFEFAGNGLTHSCIVNELKVRRFRFFCWFESLNWPLLLCD